MPARSDAPPRVARVGLDWADQQDEVRLQAANSSTMGALQLDQKREALQGWVSELRRRFAQGQIAIALERSRGAVLWSARAASGANAITPLRRVWSTHNLPGLACL